MMHFWRILLKFFMILMIFQINFRERNYSNFDLQRFKIHSLPCARTPERNSNFACTISRIFNNQPGPRSSVNNIVSFMFSNGAYIPRRNWRLNEFFFFYLHIFTNFSFCFNNEIDSLHNFIIFKSGQRGNPTQSLFNWCFLLWIRKPNLSK